MLAGERVLVTGAGGFIGSHVAERLVTAGATTRALVHYRSTGGRGWLEHSWARDHVEVVAGDLCDRDSVSQAAKGCSVVLHLGALIAIPYSYQAPESYLRTNVEGTLNVLHAAREHGVRRLVHTSTSEVYGTARRIPMDETHPLQAQSPYAASKIAADKLVESFHLSFGVPAVVVRPFNTFGPRQSARAIIPSLIAQALAGTGVRVGNTTPVRDFTYVEDTADGFVRAASAGQGVGEVVNLGTGRAISIGEVAQLIGRICGVELLLQQEPERMRVAGSEVERLCADAAKARALLGWTPAVTLEEGLRRSIQWMRDNLDSYRPEVYAR